MPQRTNSEGGQQNVHGKTHASRLSHVALESLNNWIKTHSQKPYPTKAEKSFLQQATGLNLRQIDTWFANARRRQKSRSGATSISDEPSTSAAVLEAYDGSADVADVNESEDTPTTSSDSTSSESSAVGKIYHCTFCTDAFTTKYDWTRHEISIHLPLKRYICCPLSPVSIHPRTQLESCTYCNEPNPNTDHIESHNHSTCQARPPEARIFLRKDHLRQHLRAVHECGVLPNMDTWVLQADFVNCRCGFCGERFTSWQARNDHIAAHYKQGSQMNMWKGCRGLDSSISAQVKAGLPPFLIDIASKQRYARSNSSLDSERNQTSMSKLRGNECDRFFGKRLEMLVQELQSLVQRSTMQGFMVSDQTLQHHARMLTYGQTGVAHNTAADNSEWLDTFKRAYCLNILPTSSHNHALHLPDDLEVYNDLGLPTPQCPRSNRITAFCTLFWTDGPVLKTDSRFSSVPVPLQLTLPFETIADVWPDAGTPGRIMITRDRVFECTIQAQIDFPLSVAAQNMIEVNDISRKGE